MAESQNSISKALVVDPEESASPSAVEQPPKNPKSMASAPTYRPPGYPDMGSLWTQPPQPLPDPNDHPFFRWVAEGAKKDPAVLATMSPPARPAQPSSVQRRPDGTPLSIQPRAVYPFVPPPSVSMEPMTPDLKPRQSFMQPSPAQRTPDLSSSPTEPSPSSAHTATPAGPEEQPPDDAEDNHKGPAAHRSELRENTAAKEGEQPACTSTYMRVVTHPQNVEMERKPSIVTGQIWRSGSKNEGWRRHQWSTEGSMDVG